jgi:hypothetical protein
MAKLSEWKPYERYVQGGLVDGQFLSAAFTMVAAGPPRLANIGGAAAAAATLSSEGGQKDWALPIGVVQNIGLSHNRNFARFWEVGFGAVLLHLRPYGASSSSAGSCTTVRRCCACSTPTTRTSSRRRGPLRLRQPRRCARWPTRTTSRSRRATRTSSSTWPRTSSASPSAC